MTSTRMAVVETEEQFVGVPGGEVFVKQWTPNAVQSEVPLVLLHDSLGSVEAWREFPSQLAQRVGRTVVAYDRLGFGRSSPRVETPSLRFIDEEGEVFFPAICTALGIGRFALFGYSVGGEMGVAIAGQMAGRCERLVVMSAQAAVEPQTIEGIHAAQKRFADPEQVARLRRWHGEKAEWALRSWWDVWLAPEFAGWTLAPYLPRVRCPVLVMHGDRDDYGSLAVPDMIQSLTGGPCEVHIFEGCGHVPQRERLGDVLSLTEAFMRP